MPASGAPFRGIRIIDCSTVFAGPAGQADRERLGMTDADLRGLKERKVI